MSVRKPDMRQPILLDSALLASVVRDRDVRRHSDNVRERLTAKRVAERLAEMDQIVRGEA